MIYKHMDAVPRHTQKFGVQTAVLMSMLVAGCGFAWSNKRDTNPVIHDWTASNLFSENSLDLFATTASRREVLIGRRGGDIAACAEPPPDVGEAFSAAMAAGLQSAVSASQGTDTKVAGEFAGQFARQVATQIAPLIYRSQGLQLNRDSQGALCLDLMNGFITREQYINIKKARFDKSAELISQELPNMKEVMTEYYKSVKAGSSIDASTLKVLLDATKMSPPVVPALPGEASPPAQKADSPSPGKTP